MPTKSQAASYAATLHYLKAASAVGWTDGRAVNKQMREQTGDYFGQSVKIRDSGRALYDLTLYQVKAPAESQRAWDYYKKIKVIPADRAFPSATGGKCDLGIKT
jgi:branched-chain amino acid transport system substrate-binding protein